MDRRPASAFSTLIIKNRGVAPLFPVAVDNQGLVAVAVVAGVLVEVLATALDPVLRSAGSR